jgi:hypothetical protein
MTSWVSIGLMILIPHRNCTHVSFAAALSIRSGQESSRHRRMNQELESLTAARQQAATDPIKQRHWAIAISALEQRERQAQENYVRDKQRRTNAWDAWRAWLKDCQPALPPWAVRLLWAVRYVVIIYMVSRGRRAFVSATFFAIRLAASPLPLHPFESVQAAELSRRSYSCQRHFGRSRYSFGKRSSRNVPARVLFHVSAILDVYITRLKAFK